MENKFDVYDYLVLAAVLSISIFIGLYQAIKAKYGEKLKRFFSSGKTEVVVIDKNAQIKDYLIANRSMGAVPVALSLLASFFSATSILGFPAEVYQFGIQYWIGVLGMSIPPIIGAFTTGPMFAKLKVMSVFEYLKLRYDSNFIRLIGVSCYFVRTLMSTSIFIYGPSTALTTLTNLSGEAAIVMIGAIATFYTSIGGIRSVVWTDVFQISIMFLGLIGILTKGIYDMGGLSSIWRISGETGRLNFFDFDPNPFIRQSFWSLVFGNLIHSLISYTLEQQMVQRFACARNIKTAQLALLLNIPGQFVLITLCCFTGLVLYANYHKCDPLSASSVTGVTSANQLVTYFVSDKLGSVSGATGLFLAAILSGSMSSVSSALNSVAAILWEDFLKRFSFFRNLNDGSSTLTVKLLVIICGTICTLFAFLLSRVGGNLVQLSATLNGSFNGPIIGLFILGCVFPFTNTYGAAIGTICGFGMGLWLSLGSFIKQPLYPKLPVSAECYNLTNTSIMDTILSMKNITISKEASNLVGFDKFYSISYSWFNPIAVFTTVIVGLIVSLVTCGYKKPIDSSLILFKCLLRCAPSYKKVNITVEVDEKVGERIESTNL